MTPAPSERRPERRPERHPERRPEGHPERLHALDAFRGIAALGVVLYHTTLRYPHFMLGQDTPLTPLFPGFTARDAGLIPVLWFFLISGFVITWTIERSRTPMDFVISRLSRIYPAYWASMLLTLVALWAFPLPNVAPSLTDVLVNATMLQAYALIPNVAGVYWSLSIEILFYVYALALFAAGLWRFVHWAALAWALLALAAAALPVPVPWRATQLLLLTYAPYLVAGMMLYQLWRRRHVGWSWVTLAVCLAAIAVLKPPVPTLMVAAGMGLIAWTCSGGLAWLAAPPLVWLGSISYALYLVHEYPTYMVLRATAAAGLPEALGMAAAAAVSLVLACLVSYGVERPAMRQIREAWRAIRRTPAPADPARAPPTHPATPGSPH